MRIVPNAARARFRNAAGAVRVFGRETQGVAIMEFAMVLPVLLAMCFGVLVIADAFSVKRKVAITTRTITDLTTQYAQIDAPTMTKLLNAAAAVIAPYDQSKLGVVISEVDVDSTGVGTVAWSKSYNSAPTLAQGSVVPLPANMVTPGSSVILGQATYTYSPLTSVKFFGLINPVSLSDKIFLSPRVSRTITLTN